eukprot:8299499-Pyramimonas_sp.AAC.1
MVVGRSYQRSLGQRQNRRAGDDVDVRRVLTGMLRVDVVGGTHHALEELLKAVGGADRLAGCRPATCRRLCAGHRHLAGGRAHALRLRKGGHPRSGLRVWQSGQMNQELVQLDLQVGAPRRPSVELLRDARCAFAIGGSQLVGAGAEQKWNAIVSLPNESIRSKRMRMVRGRRVDHRLI